MQLRHRSLSRYIFFPSSASKPIYPYQEPDQRFLYIHLSVEGAFIITNVGPILMIFAYIETPEFECLSHHWRIPSDQQTPEMIGSVYRKSTVLFNFRLDQERIVESLKYPCRHSLFRRDSIICGPTPATPRGDLTDVSTKTKSLLMAHGDHTNPKASHM